jgi:acyl-CoA synthetase (AMP-forming)/AMP-acid ligase II
MAGDLMVPDWIELIAEKHPERLAVHCLEKMGGIRGNASSSDQSLGETFTYSCINSMAHVLAGILMSYASKGREKNGDRGCVMIGMDEGILLVVSELAALKARFAVVPVDAVWPSARIGYVARDCQACVMLVHR